MKRENDFLAQHEYSHHIHRRQLKRAEIILWFLVSLVPIYKLVEEIALSNGNISHVLLLSYSNIFAIVFLLFFPIIFGQIFEYTPILSLLNIFIEAIDTSKKEKEKKSEKPKEEKLNGMMNSPHELDNSNASNIIKITGLGTQITFSSLEQNLKDKNSIELLDFYASSSRNLANNIFRRAGVYLLFGVMIAVIGLVFFYTQTVIISSSEDINANTLLNIIPKFGILFFIEFIAFFFLRQYRSAMDEFRYYEGIKRRREEMYSLIKYAREESKNIDPLELMKNDFFSKSNTLTNGESTEIIEARKLEKDNIEIFGKILDLAKSVRK